MKLFCLCVHSFTCLIEYVTATIIIEENGKYFKSASALSLMSTLLDSELATILRGIKKLAER